MKRVLKQWTETDDDGVESRHGKMIKVPEPKPARRLRRSNTHKAKSFHAKFAERCEAIRMNKPPKKRRPTGNDKRRARRKRYLIQLNRERIREACTALQAGRIYSR